MQYAVICNDHPNALFHMRRYMDAYPNAIVTKSLMRIEIHSDYYWFICRDKDYNQIRSFVFDGIIFPPAHDMPFNDFDAVAVTRARLRPFLGELLNDNSLHEHVKKSRRNSSKKESGLHNKSKR